MQVSAVLRLLECIFKVVLYFGYLFQVVGVLEPLHIYLAASASSHLHAPFEHSNPNLEKRRTLYNTSKFVILVKVEQLLLGVLGRRAVRGVALAAERDVGEVQAEEWYSGRGGVA